jgi:prepilin-type N-terminal cleavage/methylation domain-containing protein
MRNRRGVTLIELIVVVSIISILVIALGLSFQGWMGKYKVESEIKQIYVDLMNTRAIAMTQNRFHFTDFPTTTSYRLIEDTNGNNASNPGAGDTILPNPPGLPKTVEYAVTWAGGTIQFDIRGIISPLAGFDADNTKTMCIFTDYDGDASNLSGFEKGIITGRDDDRSRGTASGNACPYADCFAQH